MSKRIFFAFPLDDVLQSKVVGWEKEFKKRTNIPVRWTEPHDLHITLIPPWSVEEHHIDFLKGLLLPTISNTISFEIELTRVQFGPTAHAPRLIWIEGPMPPVMQELGEQMERILKNANVNFHPERRPFELHVTLARFQPEAFASFSVQELDEGVHFFGTASSVVIMQSILGFGGAEYKVLHHYLLKEQ